MPTRPSSPPAFSRSNRDRPASARWCPTRSSWRHACARVNPAPVGLPSTPREEDPVSGKVTGWVLRHRPPDRTQLLVLVVLADAARNDGTGIRISTRDIAERAMLSRGHASVVLRQLLEDGRVRRVVDGRAPGCPSEYEIPVPQAVDGRSTARSGPSGSARSGSSGSARSGSSGFRFEASSLTRYGSNGNGSHARNEPPRRRSTAEERAEQAAIAGCARCDEAGWLWVDDTAARCDHSPATASRSSR